MRPRRVPSTAACVLLGFWHYDSAFALSWPYCNWSLFSLPSTCSWWREWYTSSPVKQSGRVVISASTGWYLKENLSLSYPAFLGISQIMWWDEWEIYLIFYHCWDIYLIIWTFANSSDSEFDITVFVDVTASLKNKRKIIFLNMCIYETMFYKIFHFSFCENLFPSSAV